MTPVSEPLGWDGMGWDGDPTGVGSQKADRDGSIRTRQHALLGLYLSRFFALLERHQQSLNRIAFCG